MYPLSLLLLLTDSSSAQISRSSRFSPCRKGMLVVVTCCHNWGFQYRKLGGSQVETGLYYVGQSDEAACRHIRLRQLPPKETGSVFFLYFTVFGEAQFVLVGSALQCRQSGVLIRNGISHSWINRYWVAYCPNIEIYFLQEKKLRDLHYF